jgi:hypothetical protein
VSGHHVAVRVAAVAACGLAAALAWSGAAAGHVVPDPQFVTSGSVARLDLAVPNERREAMTGLSVTVPDGLRIVSARGTDGWAPVVEGATATWHGGPLEHLDLETFVLEVDVAASPGILTFDSVQLYPGGETVSWPVTLTVVPGDEPSQNLGWALAAGVAGVVVTMGVALLAWRRRTETLQER